MSKITKTDRKVIKAVVKSMRDDAVVSEKGALRLAKPSPVITALFKAMAAEEARQRKTKTAAPKVA